MKLQAEVKSAGPRVSLYTFGPTPDRPGTGGRFPNAGTVYGPGAFRPPLRVAVLQKKAPSPIRGAFIASLKGRLHVVRRKGKERFPISVLRGPAVPQMMGEESVIKAVEEVAQERLDARLDREIYAALEGFDRKTARGRR